jgi:hypothetical protein
MQLATILLSLLLFQQMPKNDPNGIWQSTTGTQYKLELTGSDLKVQLVEGTNPTYLKYEVNLKNLEEVNSYKGTGFFIAKLTNGKECRFETEWEIVVVQQDKIVGATSNIFPDPDTCAVKDKSVIGIDLSRKK